MEICADVKIISRFLGGGKESFQMRIHGETLYYCSIKVC